MSEDCKVANDKFCTVCNALYPHDVFIIDNGCINCRATEGRVDTIYFHTENRKYYSRDEIIHMSKDTSDEKAFAEWIVNAKSGESFFVETENSDFEIVCIDYESVMHYAFTIMD